MKISHVIPYMHPNAGGPPVVVDRVCRGLAAGGHEVRVVTTDAFNTGGTDWVRAYNGGGYDLDVHPAYGRGAFSYSRSLASALRSVVAGSDLVHLHTVWTYPTLRAAWYCRRLGRPYVVMPHGMLDPHSVRRKRLKKWLYARLIEGPSLRRAAGLVCTHAEEERLARETIPGLPRGWVVPLGADDPPGETRERLATGFFEKYGNLYGRRVVLFFGRLHPKKGLDLLIPAFAQVAAKLPTAQLVLAGPGDPAYVEGLSRSLADHGLNGRATFTGPLRGREKWGALAAADVFVLPSYQENFALTVAEAMRVATPVILSRRVNIWKDVVTGGAGLVTELDAGDLADQVLKVLEDCELAAGLGDRGQWLASELYTWDQAVSGMLGLYRDVLASNRPTTCH